MIECIFTLDYEIYGNGTGSLKTLVYEPARQLKEVFAKWDARFVAFVEVGELRQIEAAGSDRDIELVRRQIQELYEADFEIALHLHPQWFNATYRGSQWALDFAEYNLCRLPQARIEQIVDSGLTYLRYAVGDSHFQPFSFRAGNWLFQPTRTAAAVLAQRGIRIDSSVFKGGLQHNNGLDYRRALSNPYYWRFDHDVTVEDPSGSWIEVPIYTEMIPSWNLFTTKRVGSGNGFGGAIRSSGQKLNRLRDFLRVRYPLKFDFCRMTLDELTGMMTRVIQQDRLTPALYKPIVSIGHTKDLNDLNTVDRFLSFLKTAGIGVTTLESTYTKLVATATLPAHQTHAPLYT